MEHHSDSSSDADDDVLRASPRYVPPVDNRRPSIMFDRLYTPGAGFENPNNHNKNTNIGSSSDNLSTAIKSKAVKGFGSKAFTTLTPARRVGMANPSSVTPSRQRAKPPLTAESYAARVREQSERDYENTYTQPSLQSGNSCQPRFSYDDNSINKIAINQPESKGSILLHSSEMAPSNRNGYPDRITMSFWNKVKNLSAKRSENVDRALETASNATVVSDTLDSKIRYLHGRTAALAEKERGHPRTAKDNTPASPWTGGTRGGDYERFVGTKGTQFNMYNTNLYKKKDSVVDGVSSTSIEPQSDRAFGVAEDYKARPSPAAVIYRSNNNQYEVGVKNAHIDEENRRLQRKVDRDRMTNALQQAAGQIRREIILTRNPKLVEREAKLAGSAPSVPTTKGKPSAYSDPHQILGHLDYDYVTECELKGVSDQEVPFMISRQFGNDDKACGMQQRVREHSQHDVVNGLNVPHANMTATVFDELEAREQANNRQLQQEATLETIKANARALATDRTFSKDVKIQDLATGRQQPRMYSVENDIDSDSSSDAEYFSLDFKPESVMASLEKAQPRYQVPEARLFNVDKRILSEMREKVKQQQKRDSKPKQVYATSCGPLPPKTESSSTSTKSNQVGRNIDSSRVVENISMPSTKPYTKLTRPLTAPVRGRGSSYVLESNTSKQNLKPSQHGHEFTEAIPANILSGSHVGTTAARPQSVAEHLDYLRKAEAFNNEAVLHGGEPRGGNSASAVPSKRAGDVSPRLKYESEREGSSAANQGLFSVLQNELDKRRSAMGTVMSTAGGLLTVNVGTPHPQSSESAEGPSSSHPTPVLRVYDDESSEDSSELGQRSARDQTKSSASMAPSSVGYVGGACDTPTAISGTPVDGQKPMHSSGLKYRNSGNDLPYSKPMPVSGQARAKGPLIIPTRPSASSRPPTATRRPQSATVRKPPL